MKIYLSLRQLLLYQMGYLLFYKTKEEHADNEAIMESLRILQTAFEQIKSYQHNLHFHSMIDTLHYELDESDLIDVNTEEDKRENCVPLSFLHPYGFCCWIAAQSYVKIDWSGTMDDVNRQQEIWRTLIGKSFIKQWKKKQITHKNILQHYSCDSNSQMKPFTDISIPQNSIVKASQFRISLCRNPILELHLDGNKNIQKCDSFDSCDDKNGDTIGNGTAEKDFSLKAKITGCNLFNCIRNKDVLRIACCILWDPQLANQVLEELIAEPNFAPFGCHTMSVLLEDSSLLDMNHTKTVTSIISVTDIDTNQSTNLLNTSIAENSKYRMQLPHYWDTSMSQTPSGSSLDLQGYHRSNNSSLGSAQMFLSSRTPSIVSANTNYSGGSESLHLVMNDDEIYKYLLTEKSAENEKRETIGNDSENEDKRKIQRRSPSKKSKYDWKLMVDALNAIQMRICNLNEYSNEYILQLINHSKEGITKCILDQRSGLIKVACKLLIVLVEYRPEIFLIKDGNGNDDDCKEDNISNMGFFLYWIVILLKKCANRDKIRTLPAHEACQIILHSMLNFHENLENVENGKLEIIMDLFQCMKQLWKTNDNSWMKQSKSIKQFVLMITQIIHSLCTFYATNANESESDILSDCFQFFSSFMKQSHKEVRDCACHSLLVQCYQLNAKKTFAIAEQKLRKKELVEFLQQLLEMKYLLSEHESKLDELSSRGRTRKGKLRAQKKKKKSGKKGSLRAQIKAAKRAALLKAEAEEKDSMVEEKENSPSND